MADRDNQKRKRTNSYDITHTDDSDDFTYTDFGVPDYISHSPFAPPVQRVPQRPQPTPRQTSATKGAGRGVTYEVPEIKEMLYSLYLGLDKNTAYHNYQTLFPLSTRSKVSFGQKMQTLKLKLFASLTNTDTTAADVPQLEGKDSKKDFPRQAFDYITPDLITDGTFTLFGYFKVELFDHFTLR